MQSNPRLFVKVTRESLPQVKDKFPYLYLERGRLEVDSSSLKWVDESGQVIPLPAATINAILLGPGTSATHDAIRTAASVNCGVSWVGEDSLIFYAAGFSSTSDTRQLKRQIQLACNPTSALEVARRMYRHRFPDANLDGKSLKEMMGMEGNRVRASYLSKAEAYQVGWKGRSFVPGKFEFCDLTNQILTASNAALYGILCSAVHSLGLTPHVGFIHSGSPLPFVYDLADLYKETLCIDLAFSLTKALAGRYDKHIVSSAFRQRVLDSDLLCKIGPDIMEILGLPKKKAPSCS